MSDLKTILLVDDSRVSRLMLRAIIEYQFPERKVLEAVNASEALALTAESDEQIDLVTLDMNMPGIDGLTIAPQLQNNCPDATIALLTANYQDRIRNKAEKQGLIFIAKPITEDKVIEFVTTYGNAK